MWLDESHSTSSAGSISTTCTHTHKEKRFHKIKIDQKMILKESRGLFTYYVSRKRGGEGTANAGGGGLGYNFFTNVF